MCLKALVSGSEHHFKLINKRKPQPRIFQCFQMITSYSATFTVPRSAESPGLLLLLSLLLLVSLLLLLIHYYFGGLFCHSPYLSIKGNVWASGVVLVVFILPWEAPEKQRASLGPNYSAQNTQSKTCQSSTAQDSQNGENLGKAGGIL